MIIKSFKFHHIGIATRNLAKTKKIFEGLGLTMSETTPVPGQKVNVCFSRDVDHPRIELVEPATDDSPVNNFLDKVGSSPYHLCYETPDLDLAIPFLRKHGFLLISEPSPSIALDDNRICFCYHNKIGLIEIVETKSKPEE